MSGRDFLWCPDSLLPIVLTSDPAIACDNSLVVLCYLLAFHLWSLCVCRFSVAGMGVRSGYPGAVFSPCRGWL